MDSLWSLAGKTALVTGSGRGIGLTLALGLGQAGARVVVNDLLPESVAAAVDELRRAGINASGEVFDVTDPAAVAAGIDKIEKEAAPIDILFNNAGIHRRAPLADMSVSDWKMVIDTNLTSAFLVGQRAARSMIERGQGKIINICSLNSLLPRPSIGNYSAAKGGLTLLTRAMAVEWSKYNIQANGIAPGYILTEMTRQLHQDAERSAWIISRTPANRWGRPEDLIGGAVFLSSPASDFITGQVIFIDGGISVSL